MLLKFLLEEFIATFFRDQRQHIVFVYVHLWERWVLIAHLVQIGKRVLVWL